MINSGCRSLKSNPDSREAFFDRGPKRCGLSARSVDKEPGELSSESGSDDLVESESEVKDNGAVKQVGHRQAWSPQTPKDFKHSLVLRKDYSKIDTYYITPAGKKLRSRNEIAAFVDANPEFKDAPLGDFSFTVPKVMEDTFPPDAPKLASPIATPTTTITDVSDMSTKSKQTKGKFKFEEETPSASPDVTSLP